MLVTVTDARFTDHDAGRGHPERPARLAAVLDGITAAVGRDALCPVPTAPAPREAVTRVHAPELVDRLEALDAAGHHVRAANQHRHRQFFIDNDLGRAQDALKKLYVTEGRWDDLEQFYRSRGKIDEYIRDIEDFTELGEYLSLPTRVYSAGMQARLGFAVATTQSPDILLIEDKGSGISLRQVLDREGIASYAYNPGRADKLTRLHIVSPIFARRQVWLPESDKFPGRPRTWVDPLVHQLCAFTGSGSLKHDDFVDSTTQALRLMMDKNMLTAVKVQPAIREPTPPRTVVNPYAA